MRLLLLPGLDGTGTLFAPLLAALPPSLPATAVAYPPDEPAGYAGLLPQVRAAAAGDFVVVGESFSGPLALLLAAERPPGLRGVVLCASFVRPPLRVPALLRRLVRPWLFRCLPLWALARVLAGRHARGPLGTLLGAAVRTVAPAALAARSRAVLEADAVDALRACPVPVLVLVASADRVVGRRSADLVRKLRPDARVVLLPGPHLLLQAAPRETAAAIAEFCAGIG